MMMLADKEKINELFRKYPSLHLYVKAKRINNLVEEIDYFLTSIPTKMAEGISLAITKLP